MVWTPKPGNWHFAAKKTVKNLEADKNDTEQAPLPIPPGFESPQNQSDAVGILQEAKALSDALAKLQNAAQQQAKTQAQEIARLQRACEISQENISQMKRQMENDAQRNSQIQIELQNEIKAKKAAEEKNDFYCVQLNQLNAELAQTQKIKENLEHTAAAISEDIANANEKIAQQQQAIIEIRNNLTSESEAKEQANRQIEKQNSQISQLTEQIRQQASLHQAQIEKMNSAAQETANIHAEKIAQLKQDIAAIQQIKEKTEKQIDSCLHNIKQLETAIENEKLSRIAAENTTHVLRQELAKLNDDLIASRSESESLRQKADLLEKEKSRALEKIANCAGTIEELQAKFQNEIHLREQIQKNAEVQAQANAALSADIQRQANAHAEDIARLQAASQQQAQIHIEQFRQLQEAFEKEKKSALDAQNTAQEYRLRLDNLQNNLNALSAEKEALEKTNFSLSEEITRASEKISQQQNAVKKLEETIAEQTETIKNRQSQLECIAQEKDRLAQELDTQKKLEEENRNSYLLQIADLQRELKTQHDITAAAHQQLSRLQEDIKLRNEEKDSAAQLAKSYSQEIEALRQQLAAVEKELQQTPQTAAETIEPQPLTEQQEPPIALTAQCDCCDKPYPQDRLCAIDSGQRLCPECLAMIR